MSEEDYLCVGICLPDEDEAYCIGCGRPWGAHTAVPPAPTFSEPEGDLPQRTSNSKLPPT